MSGRWMGTEETAWMTMYRSLIWLALDYVHVVDSGKQNKPEQMIWCIKIWDSAQIYITRDRNGRHATRDWKEMLLNYWVNLQDHSNDRQHKRRNLIGKNRRGKQTNKKALDGHWHRNQWNSSIKLYNPQQRCHNGLNIIRKEEQRHEVYL